MVSLFCSYNQTRTGFFTQFDCSLQFKKKIKENNIKGNNYIDQNTSFRYVFLIPVFNPPFRPKRICALRRSLLRLIPAESSKHFFVQTWCFSVWIVYIYIWIIDIINSAKIFIMKFSTLLNVKIGKKRKNKMNIISWRRYKIFKRPQKTSLLRSLTNQITISTN